MSPFCTGTPIFTLAESPDLVIACGEYNSGVEILNLSKEPEQIFTITKIVNHPDYQPNRVRIRYLFYNSFSKRYRNRGGGGVLALEIDYWRLTFDLYIDVKKLWGGWLVVVYLDYNVSSGPFLSYEIEIGDGPGPELDNF